MSQTFSLCMKYPSLRKKTKKQMNVFILFCNQVSSQCWDGTKWPVQGHEKTHVTLIRTKMCGKICWPPRFTAVFCWAGRMMASNWHGCRLRSLPAVALLSALLAPIGENQCLPTDLYICGGLFCVSPLRNLWWIRKSRWHPYCDVSPQALTRRRAANCC